MIGLRVIKGDKGDGLDYTTMTPEEIASIKPGPRRPRARQGPKEGIKEIKGDKGDKDTRRTRTARR